MRASCSSKTFGRVAHPFILNFLSHFEVWVPRPWRVAHPFIWIFLSHFEMWVPRPCAFCKGGYHCRWYHGPRARRTPPHLRRPSPALYHLLLLSPKTETP